MPLTHAFSDKAASCGFGNLATRRRRQMLQEPQAGFVQSALAARRRGWWGLQPPASAPWWLAAAALERTWRLGRRYSPRLWLRSSCWSFLASHRPRPSPYLSRSRRRAATTSTSISPRCPVSRVEPTSGRTTEVRWGGAGWARPQSLSRRGAAPGARRRGNAFAAAGRMFQDS